MKRLDAEKALVRGILKVLGDLDSEDTAIFLELEPIKHFEELSGWIERPVEEGGRRNRLFPK